MARSQGVSLIYFFSLSLHRTYSPHNALHSFLVIIFMIVSSVYTYLVLP